MKFAARAYRRPLSQAEREEILGLLPNAARQGRLDARRGDTRLDRPRADVAQVLLSRRSDGDSVTSARGRGTASVQPAAARAGKRGSSG